MATVLAMEPEVLLLDEPMNGLDIKTKAKLSEILSGIDLSYMVISHDFDFLAGTTEDIYTMSEGKIILDKELQVHEHVHAHPHGVYPHRHEMTEDRGQMAGDRRQRTEDRRQRSVDRRQRSVVRNKRAED